MRLGTQLSTEILQTCLAVTINGLEVGTPECCYRCLGEAGEMKETSKGQQPKFQLQAKRMQGKPLVSNTAADAKIKKTNLLKFNGQFWLLFNFK